MLSRLCLLHVFDGEGGARRDAGVPGWSVLRPREELGSWTRQPPSPLTLLLAVRKGSYPPCASENWTCRLGGFFPPLERLHYSSNLCFHLARILSVAETLLRRGWDVILQTHAHVCLQQR